MKNQLAVSVIFHKCRGMTTFINDNPERALPMCDSQLWKSTPQVVSVMANGVQCICTSSNSTLTGCLNPPCIRQAQRVLYQ